MKKIIEMEILANKIRWLVRVVVMVVMVLDLITSKIPRGIISTSV